MPTRRDFLRTTSLLAAGLAAQGFARSAAARPRPPTKENADGGDDSKAKRPLKLLILGGTGFLGPHIVRRALARGHTMTLFNRGKTDPSAFPGLEQLRGDRSTGDLASLESHDWDGVVDTSGYFPKQVRESAGLLAAHVNQYLFISTISVYAPIDKPDADESAPLEKLRDGVDPDKLKQIGNDYGALKVLCEQAAEKEMPGQVTSLRSGLIVGPDDPSDRFTYWPVRVADGGEVLAPGTPADPVQFIDVRDLADFAVRCLEDATVGVMNAVGPKGGMPIGQMLAACKEGTKGDATFTFVPDDFLHEQKIESWSDMPVWISPREPGGGQNAMNIDRALKAGISFRAAAETARDTLAWYRAMKRKAPFPFTRAREAAALAAWHAKKKSP